MSNFFEDEVVGQFISLTMETKARMVGTPGETGEFDCPRCGAKVTVAVVGRNDHVRAACPTDGCLRLMQ